MNAYQLTIHLSPNLTQASAEKLQKEIKKEVKKQKGGLVDEGEIKKQSLSFPISDNSQSLFWNLTINLPPAKVEDLKNFLKGKKDILRAMVVKTGAEKSQTTKKDKKTATPNQSKHGSGQATEAQKRTETQKKAKPQKEKEEKVGIEDIDQKLDQILEEEM